MKLSFRIDKQKTRNQKYFVYQEKKYPIDFDLLIRNSNYFYKNRKQYKNVEYINLMNDDDQGIEIPEESIEAFISSCQNEQCEISSSSILGLEYLSRKYEYPEILAVTQNFYKEHEEDLALQSLLFKTKNKNENFSDTSQEEETIANNINKYIKQREMLSLPISVLDRIIKKAYFKEKSEVIIEFLFKVLNLNGREASILFNCIDFENESINVVHRLINDYSDRFDFNMINSTLLKTITQMSSEMTKQKEEYSKLFGEMTCEMKNKKEEYSKLFGEMKNEIEKQKEEMNQMRKEEEERNEKQIKKYEDRILNIEKRFEMIANEYERKIKSKNADDDEMCQKILLDMIGVSEFNQMKTESKHFIIKKIIQKEEDLNEENSVLKRRVLCFSEIYECIKKDNESSNENEEEERINFIENEMKLNKLSFEIIEQLYLKNKFHTILKHFIGNCSETLIEIKYPSEEFEGIMNVIYDIKRQYLEEIDKGQINIKIDTKMYDRCTDLNEDDKLICEIVKEVKCIDEQTFSLYIKSVFDKLTIKTKTDKFIFTRFEGLVRISIPPSAEMIGISAFRYCKSLEQVIIPSSVTSIGWGAFNECLSLTRIIIPSSVKRIDSYAFEGCSSLKYVVIPSSVTSIGDNVFKGCTSLIEITIPSSVTKIGSGAFYGCSSLTRITIPSSVTSIGSYVFDECSSLYEVVAPTSMTSEGYNVFKRCPFLTKMSNS